MNDEWSLSFFSARSPIQAGVRRVAVEDSVVRSALLCSSLHSLTASPSI